MSKTNMARNQWKERLQHARQTETPVVETNVVASSPLTTGADVGDVLDVLSRRKWPLIRLIVICMVAAAAVLSTVTPKYSATAQLIVDTEQNVVPTFNSVIPGLAIDRQGILTETEVLRSRALASSVIDQLALDEDPEFNCALRPAGRFDGFKNWLGLCSSLAAERTRPAVVLNTFLDRLRVVPVGDSRVISVSVTSEDPDKAAEIANTLVGEYLGAKQQARAGASTAASTWLTGRIEELENDLLHSETKAEEFRAEAGLLATSGITLTAQQSADLNAQLILARATKAAAKARLDQLSVLIESPETGGVLTANEVLQSPLIQTLRQEQVGVNRRIAELSSEYGPLHPVMIQLRAEAQDFAGQITVEVNKIAQGLRNELAVSEASEAALEVELNGLTTRMARANEDEIHLRTLEREAAVNRQLLETLLSREKELGEPGEFEFQQTEAQVISYADTPIEPSFPQKGFSLGIVFLLSILLGLVVTFIHELRQRGFLTTDQLESATKLPVLGFIPLVSGRHRKGMLDGLVTHPARPFSQAMNTVNWQLDRLAPRASKIIVVTSAVPDEGKTTIAVSLARVKALEGHKTILIDADIRKPSVHQLLDRPQSPGLTELLSEDESVEGCIAFDRNTSLDVISSGGVSPNPVRTLDSQSMGKLLKELRQKYDYIIIDTAPVVAGPDACALSGRADTTVVVVRWTSTPGEAVKLALRQLRLNGGHVSGTLLSMLDARKMPNKLYGYYGAYDAQPA